VDAAVNSLGCPKSCDASGHGECDGNVLKCCCCCGTCISCGVRAGADELAKGRAFAFKLLITISDGYANTLFGMPAYSCSNDRKLCDADLNVSAKYVYDKLGKTKVALYAVGVGVDRDVADQLQLVAGGRKDHVLSRTNFADLAKNNLELIARSCDEQVTPCGDCCGFCACGKCQEPDSCDNTSPCTNATISPVSKCCVPVPRNCNQQNDADLCHTYRCEDNPNSPNAGSCVVNTTVQCQPAQNTTCFTRECVNTTGLCQSTKLAACGPVQECRAGDLSACEDNNVCTTEQCTPDGQCIWQNKEDCKTVLPPNQCFDTECDRVAGCIQKPKADDCNDNNVCTEDRCDNNTGCTSTIKTCDDNNPCTDDQCDPINDCRFVPKVCSTNASCQIASCDPTNGNCRNLVVACTTELPVLAVTLGAAAVVGIVIAAVVAFAAFAGGGAYAVATKQKQEPQHVLLNNPTYKGAGFSGENVLFKG